MTRRIFQIAQEIWESMRSEYDDLPSEAQITAAASRKYYAAWPYLTTMMELQSINNSYGADNGRTIVVYFLANVQNWRGPVARRIKLELKELLK